MSIKINVCVCLAGEGSAGGGDGVADNAGDAQQAGAHVGAGADGHVGRALPHRTQQPSRPQW